MKLDKLDDYLIEGWRKAYAMYSTWFFIIIAALPDLYNQAIASGLLEADTVPKAFARIINLIAFAGLTTRMLKQKRVDAAIQAQADRAAAKQAAELELAEKLAKEEEAKIGTPG